MTKRTRVFLFAAAGVLVTALTTGLVAWAMGASALGSGTPEELAYVPANARMVAYADIREVMNSPFHDRIRQLQRSSPSGPDGLEARTGIRFDSDVDRVLVASTSEVTLDRTDGSLLIARGRFDAARIEGAVRNQGGQVEQYRGKRVVSLANAARETALVFAEPGLLVFGPRDSVHCALDAKAGAAAGIETNRDFMSLVDDVREATAWSVARFDTVSRSTGLAPELLNQLPPINWFAASGRIDSGLHGVIRAEAQDVQSATSLRDVVQGFLALAKLQGSRDPAYKNLLDSVVLTANGQSVSLSFDVTPAALDALTPTAPPVRRPAPLRP